MGGWHGVPLVPSQHGRWKFLLKSQSGPESRARAEGSRSETDLGSQMVRVYVSPRICEHMYGCTRSPSERRVTGTLGGSVAVARPAGRYLMRGLKTVHRTLMKLVGCTT